MINAILACDAAGGIAKNGIMPWSRNKDDMTNFVNLTRGNIVVMGRSTWDAVDMPSPLPNRTNIVITRNKNFDADDCEIITSDVESNIIKFSQDNELFIIGGAKLYSSMLPIIDRLYLTQFENDYDCDTHISLSLIDQTFNLVDSTKGDSLVFKTYERK